jgi:transcriptional regulator with XRE-family HTH domain
MDDFPARVRAALAAQGLSMRRAANVMNYDVAYLSRVLNGKQPPSAQLVEALEKLLGANGEFVTLAGHAGVSKISPTLPVLDGSQEGDFAEKIRETSGRLIIFDNEMNGLPIADVAARTYKAVHRRMGEGNYEQKAEKDIQSAAAELAEIAGWALFNAGKFSASRRFNQEALFLASLCGDRSIELITLQNQALLSGWAGRPREELAVARSVLDNRRLTPRIEAIFRAREAQGLAGSGRDSEATKTFRRARSLLQEAAPEDAPHWAWWITDREIDRQQGRALQESGESHLAIPILESAMESTPGAHVGYRNVAAVRLLACLLKEKSWQVAEVEAVRLASVVGEMSSIVSLKLLATMSRRTQEEPGVPIGVRDALKSVSDAIDEDPYAL